MVNDPHLLKRPASSHKELNSKNYKKKGGNKEPQSQNESRDGQSRDSLTLEKGRSGPLSSLPEGTMMIESESSQHGGQSERNSKRRWRELSPGEEQKLREVQKEMLGDDLSQIRLSKAIHVKPGSVEDFGKVWDEVFPSTRFSPSGRGSARS